MRTFNDNYNNESATTAGKIECAGVKLEVITWKV